VKRKDLLKKVAELGATFLRHGGNHDIYIKGKIYKSIPRHAEIDERLAKSVIKDFS